MPLKKLIKTLSQDSWEGSRIYYFQKRDTYCLSWNMSWLFWNNAPLSRGKLFEPILYVDVNLPPLRILTILGMKGVKTWGQIGIKIKFGND